MNLEEEPNWEDMLTFRQIKFANSFSTYQDEASPLLRWPSIKKLDLNSWDAYLIQKCQTSIIREFFIFLLPVLTVSLWCSVPLIQKDETKMNFYWFLFYYYGSYNLIALILINSYFNLYKLIWYPRYIGIICSNFILWSSSLLVAYLVYYFIPTLINYTITWVLITFSTLGLPIIFAQTIIKQNNLNMFRRSLSIPQKLFSIEDMTENIKKPQSYVRFKWFCISLFINIFTLILGELYVKLFISRPPTGKLEGVLYVYSWVFIVFTLDFINSVIVGEKIKSWPLGYLYRIYFCLIYFIFYRNLFINLKSKEQFIAIQIISSIWTMINFPLRMNTYTFKIIKFLGSMQTYEEYIINVGRGFLIRNMTENITMLGFICWVNIIHFGVNNKVYKLFNYDPIDEVNTFYPLTIKGSLFIWCSELISSYLTRLIFKKFYGVYVYKQFQKDFLNFPEILFTIIFLSIHVLQNMLFSVIDLSLLV